MLVRNWALVAFLACAAALGVAHAAETFGHLAPCELCLRARDIYWWTMALAVVGLVLRFTGVKAGRWIDGLLALAFLGAVGLAVYHAGVEWKFWAGPASCTGGTQTVSTADLTKLLAGGGSTPQCDKPAWVFLGLSMAGWNAIYALIFATGSAWAASRTDR
jgi:disulfide bond formation protein DsbB